MQVTLYDSAWSPVSEVIEASARGINRIRKNQATAFSFTLPSDAVSATSLDLATNVTVRGIPGRIVSKRVRGALVEVEAISSEDLLNGWRTPHDWPHWENRDLADVVRDALLPFRLIRLTQFASNGWRGRWWRRTAETVTTMETGTAPDLDVIHPTLDLTDFAVYGQADYLNARIEGWIVPAYSEAYTLYITSDDGVRVWFGGQLVVDQWRDHPTLTTYSYTTPTLTAGQAYRVVIEHYERTGGQRLRVEWQSASTPRAVIPQTAVRPDAISMVPHASSNVDLTTHFGNVTLATEPYQGAKRYLASGYVVFRLNLGSDARTTGRWVRWSEDVGAATRIKVQTRAGATEAELNAAAWGPELEQIHAGSLALNETHGVPIADGGPWVDVRFNLYTDDTETADDESNPTIYGFTPILKAVEVIYRTDGPIAAGTVPASTGIRVENYRPSRLTALRVLNELATRYDQAFRVRLSGGALLLDWTAGSFGTDRTADVRLIDGENCIIQSWSTRDQSSSTEQRQISVLNAWGKGEGADRLFYQVKDDTLIGQIGWVEDDVEFDTDSLGELKQRAEAEFAMRKNPYTEAVVEVPASVLPDDLVVGDSVALIDPWSGVVAGLTVEEIRVDEDAQSGEIVRLGLGAPIPDLLDAVIKGRSKPTGTSPGAYLPAPVLRARGRRNAIRLSWDHVAGATAYDIEIQEGGNWRVLAAGIPGPTYDHTGLAYGATRSYRLFAKAGDRRSPASNTATASARDTTAPAAPTGLTAVVGPGKVVRLTWTPPPDEDVWEYEIYRKLGNTPADPSGAVLIATEQGQVHVDTTGEYGQTYTYFVKAVDDSENASGFSTGVSATVPQPDPNPTAPSSLASIGLSVSGHSLYQDGQGNWFVKATLSLTGVPADSKRAFVQIKHRRQGSETWSLDDQLYVASGDATASVDDLLPNVTYEYAAVPVSHFGIEGTGKTASATTPKDTQAPATPTISASSIIRGIAIKGSTPAAPDWAGRFVAIGTVSGFDPDARGYWHPEVEHLGAVDGFSDVGLVDASVNPDYEDIFTDQFTADKFPGEHAAGIALIMEFYAKWNEIPAWEAAGDGQWLLQPAPDPNTYQLYRLRCARPGVAASGKQEYFRLYYPPSSNAVARIADVKVYREDNPGINYFRGSTGPVRYLFGRQTDFEITDGLTAGTTYYARVADYDTSGNVSGWSAEVSGVAGKVGTDDIAFCGISSYAIASHIETDVITTSSTDWVDMDLVSPYFNLLTTDRVLLLFKASVWNTQPARATDGRIRIETPSGNYYSGLQTRHVSSGDSHTGTIALMEVFTPTQAGNHRFIAQWKSTQTGGYWSGSGTRALTVIVLRGE